MGGIRPSGMHVNKPVVVGIVTVIVLFIFIYKLWWSAASVTTFTAFTFGGAGGAAVTGSEGSKQLDGASLPATPALDSSVEAKLTLETKTIEVPVGDTKLEVFCQQVSPADGATPTLDILLLHGARFTSADWTGIKTPQILASWGYRATAIDIPGHGQSKGQLTSDQMAQFLQALVSAAGLSNLVVVSPSASGSVALPFLFEDPAQSTQRARGFVPITPVATDKYGDKFTKSQLPTLIVYGTTDPNGPSVAKNLQLLPVSTTAPMEGAGHPCYLEKPSEFHTLLSTWLKALPKS